MGCGGELRSIGWGGGEVVEVSHRMSSEARGHPSGSVLVPRKPSFSSQPFWQSSKTFAAAARNCRPFAVLHSSPYSPSKTMVANPLKQISCSRESHSPSFEFGTGAYGIDTRVARAVLSDDERANVLKPHSVQSLGVEGNTRRLRRTRRWDSAEYIQFDDLYRRRTLRES